MEQKTIEEYLEVIYLLEKKHGYAKTGKVSLELGIKPPSVTEMLRKLQKEGYLKYERYKGAKLTETGKKLAKDLISSHQIIADFLEIIGVDRKQAEIDACELEHHISEESMEKLKEFIEFIDEAPDEPKWIEHFRDYVERRKNRV